MHEIEGNQTECIQTHGTTAPEHFSIAPTVTLMNT
jgi:hypothetical protein